QRASDAPPHRLAAHEDLIERDFERVGMAPKIDANGVADRDEINAGALGNARDLVVPGDHADALLAVALQLLQGGDGDRGIARRHRILCSVGIPRASSTAGAGRERALTATRPAWAVQRRGGRARAALGERRPSLAGGL